VTSILNLDYLEAEVAMADAGEYSVDVLVVGSGGGGMTAAPERR